MAALFLHNPYAFPKLAQKEYRKQINRRKYLIKIKRINNSMQRLRPKQSNCCVSRNTSDMSLIKKFFFIKQLNNINEVNFTLHHTN